PDIVVEIPKDTTSAKDRQQPPLDPMEELKKDVQVQRALDVIKTMRIIEQQRPGQSRRPRSGRSSDDARIKGDARPGARDSAASPLLSARPARVSRCRLCE